MRITKGEKLNDIPLVKIRDFFRKIRETGFTKIYLGYHFSLKTRETNTLIKELFRNNYIENVIQDESAFFKYRNSEFKLTEKGHTLCVANASHAINKEKADKIFKEFMQRVDEINTNDYYLCKVNKIILFGSYLNSENTSFGDIDFALELKRKINDYNEYDKIRKNRILELKQKGKHFNDFMAELNYPEREVMLKLKNKCQYISLHYIEAEKEILENTENRQIYPPL